jgi:hypothetical protein
MAKPVKIKTLNQHHRLGEYHPGSWTLRQAFLVTKKRAAVY